uniref:Uncharacterized protein n=1 Tax=Siphoviridae sp. ctquf9 TaxID=2826470 RepID=A0A8S5M3Z8_9CAUD|nr:MAG TPA: hypothetical protein [Siphoviridae sp. ctquf9]
MFSQLNLQHFLTSVFFVNIFTLLSGSTPKNS